MSYHGELIDPEDLHVTRSASTARVGQSLRYTGDGGEQAVNAFFGHLDLILDVAGDHTLTEEQASYASLRLSGTEAASRIITVPNEWGPVLVENAFANEQTLVFQCLAGTSVAVGRYQKQLLVARSGNVVGFLAAAQDGYAEISVQDLADYDLTAADVLCNFLSIQDTPTANIELFVPNGWKGVIENAMGGTYTLTVYKDEGGTGLMVKRGRPEFIMAGPDGIVRVIPPVLQGHLDVDVEGLSAHTLTEAQSRAESLRFSGALTANCTVTIPDDHGPLAVENATSGAYTLSFVRASGGTAREIPQGLKDILVARGGVVAGVLPVVQAGHQDVSVAGLTAYTLTSAQARAASLRFTGALTGNCVVTTPDDMGPLVIENATTGAYTLTLSRASGGTTLAVTQTKRLLALARTGAVVACGPEV